MVLGFTRVDVALFLRHFTHALFEVGVQYRRSMSSTSASTPAALSGSRPAVGSLRNSSSGSSASASASDARFNMPPLNSDGYLAPASGSRPAMASFDIAIDKLKARMPQELHALREALERAL